MRWLAISCARCGALHLPLDVRLGLTKDTIKQADERLAKARKTFDEGRDATAVGQALDCATQSLLELKFLQLYLEGVCFRCADVTLRTEPRRADHG